jgi:hypothetical protein
LISRKQLAAFIFLASASLARADWSGWYEAAYPVTNVFRFHPTNAPLADLYAATNTVVYTNELRFGVSTTITSRFLSNVRVDDWQGPHTITNDWLYTLRRYYTNGLYSNVVYTARVVSTLVQTSLYVQARDVWAIDCYRAVRERALASGGAWSDLGLDLYANNAAICAVLKDRMLAATDGYVDTTSAVWRAEAPLSLTNPVAPPLAVTSILGRINAPTNWPQFTAVREMSGAGVGIGRVVTTTWVIVGSSTGIVTNTSFNTCGDAVTLTGTNRQIVSMACTNADIIEGRTTLDYGWKYMRDYITNLQITASSHAFASGASTQWNYIKEGDETPSGICSYQCGAVTTEIRGIYSGDVWANLMQAGAGDSMDNGAGGTTNGFVMQRDLTTLGEWAGAGTLQYVATGVLYGATLPTAYTWRNVSLTAPTINGVTQNWVTAYGWPVAATTTPATVYALASSGAASWVLTNAIAGPLLSDFSGGIPACNEDAWGPSELLELYMCGRLMIPQTDLRIGGASLQAAAFTVLDYYASPTNGFRYR